MPTIAIVSLIAGFIGGFGAHFIQPVMFGATSVFAVFQGGSGASTFSGGLIYSPGGTTPLNSTSSPTIGWLNATSSATSTFAGGVQAATLNITSGTSTFANGIQLSAGCFRLPSGSCLTSGGSGTVTNIATTYPITGGPITTTGTLALAFGTTTSNLWALLQTFTNGFISNASSTITTGLFSMNGGASTTAFTVTGSATSTFAGGIDFTRFNQTATSTGSQGINLSGGCFSVNGTCLSSSAVTPGVVLLNTLTATSNTPYLFDTTSFTSTYKTYQIIFTNIIPVTTSNDFFIRVSTNGGASYAATSYINSTADTDAVYLLISDGSAGVTSSNDPVTGFSGVGYLHNPLSTTTDKFFSGGGTTFAVGGISANDIFAGAYDSITPVNAIQFRFGTGNIATGTIQILGIR